MAKMGRPPTPPEQTRVDLENDLLTALVQLIQNNRHILWQTREGGEYENAALHWWAGEQLQGLAALQERAGDLWRQVTALVQGEGKAE